MKMRNVALAIAEIK